LEIIVYSKSSSPRIILASNIGRTTTYDEISERYKTGSGACSRSVSSESSAGNQKRESCGRNESGRDVLPICIFPSAGLIALLTSSHSKLRKLCPVSSNVAKVQLEIRLVYERVCVHERFRYGDVTGRKVRERHWSFIEKWKESPRYYFYPLNGLDT